MKITRTFFYLCFMLCGLLILISNTHVLAQTTIADGNWSSPATWGGTPPLGSGNVVINHAVTMDFDYSHTSGSVTISGSGSLNGNSPMRLFGINFPSGTATLTNNGLLNVARIPFISGTITNNLIIQCDSMLNAATFSNAPNGIITAVAIMNTTGGRLNNYAYITTTDFLNIDSVYNANTINANDFTNARAFRNTFGAVVNLTHDFSNIDTLTSPAIFRNDGLVLVANNWHNGNEINGSGRWCVYNDSWNSGIMTGTFDFCDQTGGNVDFNTGTIGSSVTICNYNCNVEIHQKVSDDFLLYPNPLREGALLNILENSDGYVICFYDIAGKLVLQYSAPKGSGSFKPALEQGVYQMVVTHQSSVRFKGKLLVVP